jgi:hypothetical protein
MEYRPKTAPTETVVKKDESKPVVKKDESKTEKSEVKKADSKPAPVEVKKMSQSTPGEKTAEVKKGANASDKGSSKVKNEKAKKEFVPKKTEELNKKTEEKVVYDAALFL